MFPERLEAQIVVIDSSDRAGGTCPVSPAEVNSEMRLETEEPMPRHPKPPPEKGRTGDIGVISVKHWTKMITKEPRRR
jgi:hypothetical protein